jgi:hypothetical protein
VANLDDSIRAALFDGSRESVMVDVPSLVLAFIAGGVAASIALYLLVIVTIQEVVAL